MINYVVEVDVATPPDKARASLHEFFRQHMPRDHYQGSRVPNAGVVKVIKADGPAGGNPLVKVRFRMKCHAMKFVAIWYQEYDLDFIKGQIKEERSGGDQ